MASFGERVVGVLKADVNTFEEIERDTTAVGQAVTVILLAGVAALVGNFFRQSLSTAVGMMILSLIFSAIWALIVTLVGTKLMPEPATKADFSETFRVVGFTSAPGLFNVLAIVPFLGPVISFVLSLWTLVLMVIGVRQVLDYSSTGRAIVVCLIGAVISFVINFFILAPILVGRAVMGG